MKFWLHLTYIAQNSFHFDEIFHRKFKIPISICVALRRHLVAILGNIGTTIDLLLFWGFKPPLETSDEFTTPVPQRNVISQLPIQRPITNNNETRNNRNLVRSGSTRRRKSHKNRDASSSTALNLLQGLKAIHYVGEVGGHVPHKAGVYEGEGNQVNQDGIFR